MERERRPPGDVTPARRVAFAVVRRVFEQGAYADRALHGEAEGLEPRDRALATRLAFGTVQRRGSLDWIIARLARPVGELDPPVAAALRLGLYQLLFLDPDCLQRRLDARPEPRLVRRLPRPALNAIRSGGTP